jgi:hypothetical protein
MKRELRFCTKTPNGVVQLLRKRRSERGFNNYTEKSMAKMVRFTLALPDAIYNELKTWADVDNTTLNAICKRGLEEALKLRADGVGLAVIAPEIKLLLHQELGGYTNRTVHFLVKIFVEAATTKQFLFNLAFHLGISATVVEELYQRSAQTAKQQIRETSDDIKTLSRELREGLL